MKIALVGPTGFVGSKVLEEASRRGHEVTAICRKANKVPTLKSVTPRHANILNRQEAEGAFAGHDIVVSCYNCGHHPDPGQDIYKDSIEGIVNIIKATKSTGVRRLLMVGGAGALYVAPRVQLVDVFEEVTSGEAQGANFSPELLSKMPPEFAEWSNLFPPDIKHENVLPLVRTLMFFEHDMTYDWSFFSPPLGLYPGNRRGKYTLGGTELPMIGERYAGLSLGGAAVVLLDEIENPKHTRKHWTAYYSE
jgi:putative NADH-flavin reductase